MTYSCVTPFGTGAFPAFPATGTKVSLAIPLGFTVVSSPTVSVGGLATGPSAKVSFTVRAGPTAGSFPYGVTADGLASGSPQAWQKYAAYSYTDRIGGSSSGAVSVK